ncbi:KOW motif-containing protein [Mahella australiensis]|jgi:transcriptional antiterminator NusG|uniref:KOW motif-containing protein n=1 Tax=Mahella australiensis TaxID=252966 RepID=UPI0002D775D1|nr:KOW motif-containing protein [Mahella australiensis]
MQPLLALTKASEIIGLSTCSLTDGRIIVLNGPLKGYEGIIVSVDKRKGRAKVRMNIMGYERLVDLGLNIIGLV